MIEKEIGEVFYYKGDVLECVSADGLPNGLGNRINHCDDCFFEWQKKMW